MYGTRSFPNGQSLQKRQAACCLPGMHVNNCLIMHISLNLQQDKSFDNKPELVSLLIHIQRTLDHFEPAMPAACEHLCSGITLCKCLFPMQLPCFPHHCLCLLVHCILSHAVLLRALRDSATHSGFGNVCKVMTTSWYANKATAPCCVRTM